MPGPDWVPVLDALDVVPHAIAVDHRSAGGFRDREHAAVDVGRHTGQHLVGWRPKPCGPGRTNQVVIAADASRRHDNGLGMEFEVSDRYPRAGSPPLYRARFEDRATYAIDSAAVCG